MPSQSYGSVGSAGNVYIAGSGNWSSSHPETGIYQVTFQPPLSNTPVVVVSGIGAETPGKASGNVFVAYDINESGFTLESRDMVNNQRFAGAFSFIAMTQWEPN